MAIGFPASESALSDGIARSEANASAASHRSLCVRSRDMSASARAVTSGGGRAAMRLCARPTCTAHGSSNAGCASVMSLAPAKSRAMDSHRFMSSGRCVSAHPVRRRVSSEVSRDNAPAGMDTSSGLPSRSSSSAVRRALVNAGNSRRFPCARSTTPGVGVGIASSGGSKPPNFPGPAIVLHRSAVPPSSDSKLG